MDFIRYCDPILQILDNKMMSHGLSRSRVTVTELGEQLKVEEAVVCDALKYLETWEYVSCERDISGRITKVSITLSGTRVVTDRRCHDGA